MHCARLAGLDPGVLQRAKQVLGGPVPSLCQSACACCQRTRPFSEHMHILRLLRPMLTWPAYCPIMRPATPSNKTCGRRAASHAQAAARAHLQ